MQLNLEPNEVQFIINVLGELPSSEDRSASGAANSRRACGVSETNPLQFNFYGDTIRSACPPAWTDAITKPPFEVAFPFGGLGG